MTRLFTDGAEYGDLIDWGASSFTASSAQKRSGVYSYSIAGGAAGYGRRNFLASSEIYVRIAFYVFSSLENYAPIKLRKVAVDIASLSIVAATGKITINVGGTPVATSIQSIAAGVWNLIEWHLKIADAPNGISEIKINGATDVSFTGDTKPGADTTVDNLYFETNQRTLYFDDLAINDTGNGDGLNDNSWCGDGKVELLVPSGNSPDGGWTDDWTGSDGNKVDNYALVDEVPPSSADYVEDSTPGNQDRYALTDFTGTGKQILRVWVEGRALDTVPEGAQMKLGLRLSAADYLSAAITLASVYGSIVGTPYKQNPATGPADWADADLDAAQIVLETV